MGYTLYTGCVADACGCRMRVGCFGWDCSHVLAAVAVASSLRVVLQDAADGGV